MKSISFKNFRRFADFPEFKFGDITILVGGNNAGKSTLLKALILLVDNMKELRSQKDDIFEWNKPVFSFDMDHIHQLNLGTLGRALRIGSDIENELQFTATIGNFRITFDAGNSSYDLNLPTVPTSIRIEDLKRNVVFDTEWAGRMSVEFKGIEDDNFSNRSEIEDEIVNLEKELNTTDDLGRIASLNEQLEKLNKVKNAQTEKSESSTSGYACTVVSNYINLIADQDYSIPSNPLARMVYQWVAYQLTKPGLAQWRPVNLDDESEVEALEKFKASTSLSDLVEGKGEQNPYEDFHAEEEAGTFFHDDHEANHILLEDKVTMLRDIAFELENTLHRLNDFDEVYYIQAHAITQRVLYSIDNRNDHMAKVLHRFARENILKGTEPDRFLCEWLAKFDIGLDYRIKSIAGEGYTVEVETSEGVWQHIADLGMGSNQLVTLLFELATLLKVKGNRQYPFIIVEEPEQNLHPKIQSKLADLFSDLNKDRGFKFLIETHSEYLIRRTQVLVSNMELNENDMDTQNPFKVYYFPSEGNPYDMRYLPNGHFEEAFGEGFFDEAGKWTRELVRNKRR